MDVNIKNEILDFITALRKEREAIAARCHFLDKHKFQFELMVELRRINTINTILYQLELVVELRKLGKDAAFFWGD